MRVFAANACGPRNRTMLKILDRMVASGERCKELLYHKRREGDKTRGRMEASRHLGVVLCLLVSPVAKGIRPLISVRRMCAVGRIKCCERDYQNK